MDEDTFNADPIAVTDQIAAHMRNTIRIAAGYLDGLVQAGFSRDEALLFVRDWHADWWAMMHRGVSEHDDA